VEVPRLARFDQDEDASTGLGCSLSEGQAAANGRIQAAKAKARGYGTTRHLITISYLIAGKLTHLPASPFQNPVAASNTL